MRIAQFVPGTGSLYCENCLRDASLVRALRELGHEVVKLPLYLPPPPEWRDQGDDAPVFFGGIRVYLKQRHAFFRRLPRWVDRLLDSPPLLRAAGRRVGMTEPGDLAETTVSMLRGEDGRQRRELEDLVEWLRRSAPRRPDVVCLSNLLLAGLARRIRRALGAPVVCILQDEDTWLDAMPEPYRSRAWETVARRARDIDVFVAVSGYFARLMRERLGLPGERVRVVRPGVPVEHFAPAASRVAPPTVGYVSPIRRGRGLEVLADAFALLKKRDRVKGLRLRVAGQGASEEAATRAAVEALRSRLPRGTVEILHDLRERAKPGFYRGITLLTVPLSAPEAFGIPLVEAMASGVPVVQPRQGSYVEIVESTGGGVLYEPGGAEALADALEELLLDEPRRAALAQQGRRAVLERFTSGRMAREMAAVYEEVPSGAVRGTS